MAKKKILPLIGNKGVDRLSAVIQSGDNMINDTLKQNFEILSGQLNNQLNVLSNIRSAFTGSTQEPPLPRNVLETRKKNLTLGEETLIAIRVAIGDLIDINLETLDVLKGDRIKEEEERREAKRHATKPNIQKATSVEKNAGGSKWADILKGLGAAGAGLGAFFLGLAGSEAIMAKFGNGANMKAMLTNLAEGLSAFSTRDLMAIGALLGTGALFGAVPLMSGMGAGIGMAAVGLGLGGFFGGLALGDAAAGYLKTDGSHLKVLMQNLAEGLGAFSNENMIALGALLGTGALFGAVGGVGNAMQAAVGMSMFGLGIGGFFGGLALGDAAGTYLQSDGSTLKTLMINLAEGLNAFSGRNMVALGALLGAGALFGSAGGTAALGMTAIGLGLAGFLGAFSTVTDMLGFFGVDGSGARDMMVNIGAGLQELGKVDAGNILALIPAIAGLGPAMLMLLGSNGLAGVGEAVGGAVKKAWNWMFGDDEKKDKEQTIVDKIIQLIKPFENLDPAKYAGIAKVGEFFGNFAKGMAAFQTLDTNKVHEKLAALQIAKGVAATGNESTGNSFLDMNIRNEELRQQEVLDVSKLSKTQQKLQMAKMRAQGKSPVLTPDGRLYDARQIQQGLKAPAAIDVSPKAGVSGGVTGAAVNSKSNATNNINVQPIIANAPTNVNNSSSMNVQNQTVMPLSASRRESTPYKNQNAFNW